MAAMVVAAVVRIMNGVVVSVDGTVVVLKALRALRALRAHVIILMLCVAETCLQPRTSTRVRPVLHRCLLPHPRGMQLSMWLPLRMSQGPRSSRDGTYDTGVGFRALNHKIFLRGRGLDTSLHVLQ